MALRRKKRGVTSKKKRTGVRAKRRKEFEILDTPLRAMVAIKKAGVAPNSKAASLIRKREAEKFKRKLKRKKS